MIRLWQTKVLFNVLLCFLAGIACLKGQTPVFYEGFESCSATNFPPSGWEVEKHNPDSVYYHWQAFVQDKGSIEGRVSAYIDTKQYQTSTDYPEKPKHELLKTPSIQLPSDMASELSFVWQAQSIDCLDKKHYNTWLLVTTNDGVTYDTLWSLTDERAMVNSGVTFPWANFGTYKSSIDLSKYKGKQIKIAWYYHNFAKGKGNMFKLDAVKIEKYNPVTGPKPQLNQTAFSYPESYLGVTVSSGQALILSNVGIDTLRVTSVEGLEGTDFKCMLDLKAVFLTKNAGVYLPFFYTPSTTGAAKVTATIKTNGGDLTVELTGRKISLPAGYMLESFEGDLFPPIGWQNTGWKQSYVAAYSGFYGIGISGAIGKATLTSPRLDLSKTAPQGGHYLTFDATDFADDEVFGSAHDNIDIVELSQDGGLTWTKVYESEVTIDAIWAREKIILNSTSDNCYIRFVYNLDITSMEDILVSSWYVDNVVLPPYFGADNTPSATKNPIPANDAPNQFINNVTLSWDNVIFASSYKVKVGTSATTLTDVYNNSVANNRLSISGLQYNKTYYWQVIPNNANGDATGVETWSFTTMSDPSITSLPYTTGFEDATFPPLGWRTDGENEYNKYWSTSDVYPYEGKKSATSGSFEGKSILLTPPIVLPASPAQQVSFIWGNNYPAGLMHSDNPPMLNTKLQNTDTVYFEVSLDEVNWKILGFVSEASKDTAYWRRAKFSLGEYAGHTIYMRWQYSCVNWSRSKGGALDNVVIEEYNSNGKIMYNYTTWDAGVVNAKTAVSSKNLSMTNDGASALILKSVGFVNSNFSSNIVSGMTLGVSETKNFTLTFTATTAGDIKDTMVLEFTNGLISKFPVHGNALAENTRCYTFDNEEPFRTTYVDHFTVVDVDGSATIKPIMIDYPNIGKPFAFMVLNVKTADWRNIYPVSGDQCLYVSAPDADDRTAEDWIISEALTATNLSKFRFFGKSYGGADQFPLNKVSVLVSTKTNARADFEVLPGWDDKELPHSDQQLFTEFNIDLSSFAGKAVYIAVRHTSQPEGFVAFFDDFWFENFVFSSIDNQAPYFVTNSPTTAKIGKSFEYSFKANDPDGDAVTYSIKGLPGWLTETYENGAGVVRGTPTVAGPVYFVITASDAVLKTTQEVLFDVKADTLSNEKLTEIDLKIFPNPTSGRLSIQTSAQDYSISVVNTTGVEVYRGKNEKDLYLDMLPSGMYLLRIKDAGNVAEKRFIKR